MEVIKIEITSKGVYISPIHCNFPTGIFLVIFFNQELCDGRNEEYRNYCNDTDGTNKNKYYFY